MSEGQLKALRMADTVPSTKYRPRRRKELSLQEHDEIVSAYLDDMMPQKEIALKYRVSLQLVRDLVSESKNNPEKKRLAKEKVKM